MVIVGPTASGKSSLALALSRHTPSMLINADASQVYRDLRIVSARPSIEDEAQAPHRLFGTIDGAESCSAARWAQDAKAAIAEAQADQRLPVLVGGTGLYVRTLLDGIAPVPEIDPAVRAEIRAMETKGAYAALRHEDGVAAARLNPADRTRIARALEVVRSTGRPLHDWQSSRTGGVSDDFEVHGIVLLPPRDWLRARCDQRFDMMLDTGGLDEVKALADRKLPPDLPVMRALGVGEMLGIIADPSQRPMLVESAKAATRQYAKRQYTWFRHQTPDAWPRYDAIVDDNFIDEIVIKLRDIALTR